MTEAYYKAAILEAEQRRQAALVGVDLQALDKLFADDLIHIHSTGLVHGKAELLAHINRKRGFLAVRRGPLEIRIEGDIAVMTGSIENRMHGREEGSEIVMNGFVTQVLRREVEGWKFINFQFTLSRET